MICSLQTLLDAKIKQTSHEEENKMRTMIKAFSLLMVSILVVTALGACTTTPTAAPVPTSQESPTTAPTSAPTSAPTAVVSAKDTLVILSAESFTGSWDPAGHTVLANLHLEQLVFDRLWEVDASSGSIVYVPRLALSWKYLADGVTLEVKLRPGVKFQDGEDFTAADVAASIERYSDPTKPMGFFWAEQMVGTVVDPLTVDISTKSSQPYAPLINNLSFIEMMSATDIQNEANLKAKMNGTGPYKWVSYQNEEVTLVANENYWDVAPKIKNVIYRFVADPATRLSALQSGEADLIERVDPDQLPTITADANLDLMKVISNELKTLVFKWQVPPMNQTLVRQAISYAIDRETIVNSILGGNGTLADCFVAPGVWGYAPIPGFPTYDPAKAKALLVQAGYPDGNGLPTLTFVTSVGFYPKTKEYGEVIVSNLADVGIKVTFQPMETASWLAALYTPTSANMVDTGWMNVGPDPDNTLFGLYKNPGLTTGGGTAGINEVLVNEGKMVDPVQRSEYLKSVVFPLIETEMPQLPLFASMLIYAKSKDLQGFVPTSTSSMISVRYTYFTSH
jgi:peptide/nickel transport system substrate-binding protein